MVRTNKPTSELWKRIVQLGCSSFVTMRKGEGWKTELKKNSLAKWCPLIMYYLTFKKNPLTLIVLILLKLSRTTNFHMHIFFMKFQWRRQTSIDVGRHKSNCWVGRQLMRNGRGGPFPRSGRGNMSTQFEWLCLSLFHYHQVYYTFQDNNYWT